MCLERRIQINVIRKKDTDLFNEIPVVGAAQRVSLYLFPSMLMMVKDHLFTMSILLWTFVSS